MIEKNEKFFENFYSEDKNAWWRRKNDSPIEEVLNFCSDAEKVLSVGAGDMCEALELNSEGKEVYGIEKNRSVWRMYKDRIDNHFNLDILEESPDIKVDKSYDVNCFIHIPKSQQAAYLNNLSSVSKKHMIVMPEADGEKIISEDYKAIIYGEEAIKERLENLGYEVKKVFKIQKEIFGTDNMAVIVKL